MEAEAPTQTKAEFLREKMSNLTTWLYDKLYHLHEEFPRLKLDTKEEVLKKLNTFENEEDKLKRETELFDTTKHICLNVLGGVELDLENSLQRQKSVMLVRSIVAAMIGQAIVAVYVKDIVETKKKSGEIPMEEVVEVSDPLVQQNLLKDVQPEVQALMKNVTMRVMQTLKEEDFLRICNYINCFIDVVTNL